MSAASGPGVSSVRLPKRRAVLFELSVTGRSQAVQSSTFVWAFRGKFLGLEASSINKFCSTERRRWV